MFQMFIMLLSPVTVMLFIFAPIYPESDHDWCFFLQTFISSLHNTIALLDELTYVIGYDQKFK